MFESTPEDVYGALATAKNLNAALKNFLKREIQRGQALERLTKDFRAAVLTGKPAAIQAFVEKHYPKNEGYFLALARYTHAEFIGTTVDQVLEKYAEEFNTTYEKIEGGIQVTNQPSFAAISSGVVELIEASLKNFNLPDSNYLKRSTLFCIFDTEVLPEVFKVLASTAKAA